MGIALLCLAVVSAAEAQDNQAQSGPDGYTPGYGAQPSSGGSSGNIIGYQPIPNSMLGSAPTAPQQQYAMAPGQAQIQGQPPVVPLGRTPTGTYNYTLYLVGNGPYTLGRDDVINIDVRNQPEFSGNYIIGPDGSIQYNYIGDIPLAGMTKYEVQQVLVKLLERYIRSPYVSVTILAYNSKAVYVIGEVNRPGKYIMRGDVIKLREAIVAAGLPTRQAAQRRTHIVKPDLVNPQIRKINLKKILYKGKLKDDIDLYPGEIIVVPSTVLSSVNRFLSDLLNPVTRAASAASIGAGL
jgi:polysaccharide export outer membrane protein